MTKCTGIVDVALASKVCADSTSPFQRRSFAREAHVVERALKLVVVEAGAASHGGSDERGARHEKTAKSTASWCEAGIDSAVAMRKGNWCREWALEEPALDRVEASVLCTRVGDFPAAPQQEHGAPRERAYMRATRGTDSTGRPGRTGGRVRGRVGGGGSGSRHGRKGSMGEERRVRIVEDDLREA
jgi:hypothetical protein